MVNADAANNEVTSFYMPTLLQCSQLTLTTSWALDTGSSSVPIKVELLQAATVIASKTQTLTSTTAANVTLDALGTDNTNPITWTSGAADNLWLRCTWKVA